MSTKGREAAIRIVAGIVLGVVTAASSLLAGCGDSTTNAGYRLKGKVVDAETGERVSRETIYLHFFCDAIKAQKTIDRGAGSTYDVLMPQATIRVRVADKSDRYKLFEQTITLASKQQTFDIPLVPTHNIRLHGKVAGYRPPGPDAKLGDSVLFYFEHGGRAVAGPMAPDSDGTYSLYVPRGIITITAVNMGGKIKDPTVDLTGKTGKAHQHDIEFE